MSPAEAPKEDVLCDLCHHSINYHQGNGCTKRKPPKDKTIGDFCPCSATAADLAIRMAEIIRIDYGGDVDQFLTFIDTCLTDPAHITVAESESA